MLHLEVRNESISGKTLLQIKDFLGRPFVCSRIRHEGHVSIPNHETIFHVGDQLFIVCSEEDAEAVSFLYRKRNTRRLGKAGHSDGFPPYPRHQVRNQWQEVGKPPLPQHVRCKCNPYQPFGYGLVCPIPIWYFR